MTSTTIKKTVRPGSIPNDDGLGPASLDVFCRIDYDGTRLSITGTVGPKSNGDAWGSSGQIDGCFAHRDPAADDARTTDPVTVAALSFAAGWDEDRWLDFLAIWGRWHLNDMRAECEHQRALGWREQASEPRTIYHWRLRAETSKQIREAVKGAVARLRKGETVTLTPGDLALAQNPEQRTTTEPDPPSPLYEAVADTAYSRSSETKTRGWLREEDHPDGLLMKACPECGYRYGSEWRREEVPADVLDFLAALPEADKTPAWV